MAMNKKFKSAVRRHMKSIISEHVDQCNEVDCTGLAEATFAHLEGEFDLRIESEEEEFCFEAAVLEAEAFDAQRNGKE